jgi:hypothetical protein
MRILMSGNRIPTMLIPVIISHQDLNLDDLD